jgi:hypothetical protein
MQDTDLFLIIWGSFSPRLVESCTLKLGMRVVERPKKPSQGPLLFMEQMPIRHKVRRTASSVLPRPNEAQGDVTHSLGRD